MDMLPLARSDCRGSRYCNKWRVCERCARIRASKFADRAQYLERRFGRLVFLRTTPDHNTESEIRKLRDSILREKLAPAGLWTIETGELFAKLHLNILAPEAAIRKGSVGFEYAEPVRSSARAAAAYICDRSGMPHPSQYAGRLQGEWGTVAQLVMGCNDLSMAPVQAALVEQSMWTKWTHKGVSHFTLGSVKVPAPWEPPVREKTREEYAEIARRNLSNIYATIAGYSQK